jgi:hypothetical protein
MSDTKQKTTTEILNETAEFYRTHPRSTSSTGTCRYNGPMGEKCAYSRLCTVDSIFLEDESSHVQHDAVLLPEYAGHTTDFYLDLQDFHDTPTYWVANEQGGNDLTVSGQERLARLIALYELPVSL